VRVEVAEVGGHEEILDSNPAQSAMKGVEGAT
jgi:hypothetical protein